MKKSFIKQKLSRVTGNYTQIDKKILGMKKSWDEVDKLLQPSNKNKKDAKNKK